MAMTQQYVKENEQNLIGSFPNTYTFTKNLAEKYLRKHQGQLNCVIWRPSIIAGSVEQPFKGWTDSISAAGGLTVLGALGILKHLHIPKPNPFDMIPVDIVSNGILVATAYHGSGMDGSKLTVYNCTTSSQNPLTVEGYKDVALENAIYF